MKPTTIAIVLHKLGALKNIIRIFILKLRGLTILEGSKLGSISCEWPNNLSIGNNCDIQDNVDFRIGRPYDANCSITIGSNVFIGRCCEFVNSSKISIGNNCMIASSTTVNNTGHEFSKNQLINKQPITIKEIILEEDVWVGTSCIILQGVTIGQGAVIAAGSVVNKSIPPYEVWGGVPARFIKKRI